MSSFSTIFPDRAAAGEALANRLTAKGYHKPVILAIPNGGVPVAAALARQLMLPLNLCLVAKIRFSLNKRIGLGAVYDSGAVLLNEDYIYALDVERETVLQSVEEARQVLAKQSQVFKDYICQLEVSSKTAIIIDDGMASGYTALAAVKLLRQYRPNRIVFAVPVSSYYARCTLLKTGVEFVSLLSSDDPAFLVDDYYDRFEDLTHEHVRTILAQYAS